MFAKFYPRFIGRAYVWQNYGAHMLSEMTLNLNVPNILPALAQKHVTHNGALGALDTLIHLSVVSDALTQTPTNSGLGDNYILPCSIESLVSDSNLIYLCEPLNSGATAHAINFVRALGVWG